MKQMSLGRVFSIVTVLVLLMALSVRAQPTEEDIRRARRARAQAAYSEMMGDMERALENYELSLQFFPDETIEAKVVELRTLLEPEAEEPAEEVMDEPMPGDPFEEEQVVSEEPIEDVADEDAVEEDITEEEPDVVAEVEPVTPDPEPLPEEIAEPAREPMPVQEGAALVREDAPDVAVEDHATLWLGRFHMTVPVTWQPAFDDGFAMFYYGLNPDAVSIPSLVEEMSVEEANAFPSLSISLMRVEPPELLTDILPQFTEMIQETSGQSVELEFQHTTLGGRDVHWVESDLDVELSPESPKYPGFMQSFLLVDSESQLVHNAIMLTGGRITRAEQQSVLDAMLASIDWDTPAPFRSAGSFEYWDREERLPYNKYGPVAAADGRIVMALGDTSPLVRIFGPDGSFLTEWEVQFDDSLGRVPRLQHLYIDAQDRLYFTVWGGQNDYFVLEYSLAGELLATLALEVEMEDATVQISNPRMIGRTEQQAFWLQMRMDDEIKLVQFNPEGRAEVMHTLDRQLTLHGQLPNGAVVGTKREGRMDHIFVMNPHDSSIRSWTIGGIHASAFRGDDRRFFALNAGMAVDNEGLIYGIDTMSNVLFVYTGDGRLQQTFPIDAIRNMESMVVGPDGRLLIADRGSWSTPAQIHVIEPQP